MPVHRKARLQGRDGYPPAVVRRLVCFSRRPGLWCGGRGYDVRSNSIFNLPLPAMSYVLHLWRHPVPVSREDAQATLRDLRQQLSFSPDAAAGQLLEAIASALPPEGDPQDYWTEIPEPDPFALVQSLSPSVAELEVVLPVIETIAAQMGWVVFDPQSGQVHTPSGQVIGPAGAGPAVADVPVPPDLDLSPSARSRWVQQSLEPLFVQRGWRKLRGEFWFKKKLPVGEAQVCSNMVRDTLHHGVWIRVALPSQVAEEDQ